MYIVADENIALLDDFFAHLGKLHKRAGRQLSALEIKEADVLLVRSVTQVNAQLLQDSRVRFVGSATIGDDHLDKQWLDSQGITWRTAPACNAKSVVEYVFAALAYLSEIKNLELSHKVLGIIGLGNVGSLLASFAQHLGFTVIGYDPFTQHTAINQVELEQLLAQADIVSLHTPLTKTGAYPSFHLLNENNLRQLKQGAILLNSGRGAAIDNQALLAFMTHNPHHLAGLVLDVWEGEPMVNSTLAQKVDIVTPHIAGYSLEGKWRGTEMIYLALCDFYYKEPQYQLKDFLPNNQQVLVWPNKENLWQNYAQLLQTIYPITKDNQAFRQTLLEHDDIKRALAFDNLRKHYWHRRESSAYAVQEVPLAYQQAIKTLGFEIIA